jgi:anti-sigma B factor antagonist
MQLSERKVNGVAIVDVAGNLTVTENPGSLKETVTGLIRRGDRKIVLNVGKLDYVDSSCLGEIVACYTTAACKGGTVKLLQTRPHLRHLLELTKLDSVFESYETEAEVIASFKRPGRSRAALVALGLPIAI